MSVGGEGVLVEEVRGPAVTDEGVDQARAEGCAGLDNHGRKDNGETLLPVPLTPMEGTHRDPRPSSRQEPRGSQP